MKIANLMMIIGLIGLPLYAQAEIDESNANRQVTSASAEMPSTAPAHSEVYKFEDGYGQYMGQGKTKIEAQSSAREACVNAKVDAYEGRHGQVPDADTADLM